MTAARKLHGDLADDIELLASDGKVIRRHDGMYRLNGATEKLTAAMVRGLAAEVRNRRMAARSAAKPDAPRARMASHEITKTREGTPSGDGAGTLCEGQVGSTVAKPFKTGKHAHRGEGYGHRNDGDSEGRGSEGLQPERQSGRGGNQGDHGVTDLQDGDDSRPRRRQGGTGSSGGDHANPNGQHVVRPSGNKGAVKPHSTCTKCGGPMSKWSKGQCAVCYAQAGRGSYPQRPTAERPDKFWRAVQRDAAPSGRVDVVHTDVPPAGTPQTASGPPTAAVTPAPESGARAGTHKRTRTRKSRKALGIPARILALENANEALERKVAALEVLMSMEGLR